MYFSDVLQDSWPMAVDVWPSSPRRQASLSMDDDSSEPSEEEEAVPKHLEKMRGKWLVAEEPARK